MKKYLLIAAVIISIIVIIIGVLLILFPPTLGTTVTLSDFDSKEQLMKSINAHLPVDLPESAKVESFKYESWIEWDLWITVKLTTDEVEKYVQKVANVKSNEKVNIINSSQQSVDYTLKKSNAQCKLLIDSESGKIEIECGAHN